MLKLEIDGIIAHLNPNTAITIKMSNPAFNNEGTFSYPITALVERNRAIFKHIESEDNFTEYKPSFNLWIDDEIFMQGEITFSDMTSANFQFYLKSGKSSAARILKESYLDGEINGQSWGDNPTGLTGINASVNNIYPTNKFVVAPVSIDEAILNEWDVTNQILLNPSLGDGNITPMVYVRHIIDRINQALTLSNEINDFANFEDFKRLCIFSPRSGNYAAEAFTQYKEWLPHVLASDFLNDLATRFNIIPFFNPLLKAVDYIHFDTLLNGDIIDWTDKYIEDSSKSPFSLGFNLLKNNVYDDDDGLSPREIEEKYDLTEVADYGDMTFDHEAYKLTNSNRYFKVIDKDFENDLTEIWYPQAIPGVNTYLSTTPLDSTDEETNIITTPGQENYVESYTFRREKGVINDNIQIKQLGVKTDVAQDVELIVIAIVAEYLVGIVEIGRKSITISNTDFEYIDIDLPIYKKSSFEPIENDNGVWIAGTQLAIYFYCYHPTNARTITTQSGLIPEQPPLLPYTMVIPDDSKKVFKEIGVIGNYEFGDLNSENVNEVDPAGNVLFNDIGTNEGYKFQMPVSDIDPDISQTDYAYTIYRGIIDDEYAQNKEAPYCNFDDVDLELNDYQSRLTGGSIPDLSLRWHGDLGLVQQNWLQRLIWFTNYNRPVRKNFRLTLHDIVNLKMYNRIRVNNVLYIFNVISVKVNVNGNLSDAEIDLFTV